ASAVPVDGAEQCLNQATFVADVTVADNTELSPGQSFAKMWRLRNDGTCVWGPGYSLVFVEGERMSAPEFVPLQRTTLPGQTADLAVNLEAPEEPGTYPAYFMLRAPDGRIFGIGPEAETAFWLQIVVVEE
ncbi:MAG: NBR1-Ig-like domain-containing protein, partial [Candidatus Promineifilaceae bacterium]|nr:NBR1-Ig-like domain-containing protein [Candidatus Promineifilaceae bacterium]